MTSLGLFKEGCDGGLLEDLLETVAEVAAEHVDGADGVAVVEVLDLAPEEVTDGHVPVRKPDNGNAVVVVETAEVLIHGIGIPPNDAASTPSTTECTPSVP